MSVPAYKRQENKMTIINKTEDLMKEVIRLSKNEKILPKKTEKLLKQDFITHAKNIYKFISLANELNLNDPEEHKLRYQFQLKAKTELSFLHSQIKLNIVILETSYGKYENLISIISSVKQLLKKWVDSDLNRK